LQTHAWEARCRKPWGLPEHVLAATHPELVAVEWVRDANLPVLPEVVSARNGKTVIWRCADYQMSPKARVLTRIDGLRDGPVAASGRLSAGFGWDI
jgi:hypothetical protein